MRYCGCALLGGVLGVAILAVAALVISEFCDANLWGTD